MPQHSSNARLLLTLHPEIGCQTWTRTKTSGLTDRRATLTPPGKGTAGRTSTCIVPFRRRMPHVFGHGSNLKLVSTAGVAPAIPRSQAECVGCYATRCSPRCFVGKPPGSWFLWGWGTVFLEIGSQTRLADPELHTQPSRRQRGALLIELRIQKWWEVLVMLQSSSSSTVL